MKNRWIGIIVIVLISILLGLNNRYELVEKNIGETSQKNQALTLNTSYDGISIFYDTLRKLEYPVAINTENFLENYSNDIHIITENEVTSSFVLEDAEKWIRQGGKLLYLTDKYEEYEYPDIINEYEDRAHLYAIGDGKLLIGDINLITNRALLKDSGGAYFIIECIDSLGGRIYFNEYYRFLQGQSPSLFKNFPLHIKILLLQIFLVIIAVVLYFGKGFGRPKAILDEVQRSENEYLLASANLYEKSDSISAIYDYFYNEIKDEIRKTFKQSITSTSWIDLWEENNLPCRDEALRVYENEKEAGRKELGIVKDMDKLIYMLVQRREKTWKRLGQRNL